MKLRIKFSKYGAVKYTGHLDVMRYMQKMVRKSGIPVEYSKGFNPHQLIFFAQPLGVGLTSDGEYFDLNLREDIQNVSEIKDTLNANMIEGFHIEDVRILKEDAKNPMSLIEAAEYVIALKDDYAKDFKMSVQEFKKIEEMLLQDKIEVVKKTKKSENLIDIRPHIMDISCEYKLDENSRMERYSNGISVYMKLGAGSETNIKPELVLKTFLEKNGILLLSSEEYMFQIHRLEMYCRDDEGWLIPLGLRDTEQEKGCKQNGTDHIKE